MRLLLGLQALRKELPGAPGFWVEFRKMTRGERTRWSYLKRQARGFRELSETAREELRQTGLDPRPLVDAEADQQALEHILRCSVVGFRLPCADGTERLSAPDDKSYNAALLDAMDEELEAFLILGCFEANGFLKAEAEAREEALGNSGGSPEPSGEGEPTKNEA